MQLSYFFAWFIEGLFEKTKLGPSTMDEKGGEIYFMEGENKRRRARIRRGLERLAFGTAEGAVLFLEKGKEAGASALRRHDFFGVSEVKKSGDGFSIKFCDRQKAIELLLRLEEEGQEGKWEQLLMALGEEKDG